MELLFWKLLLTLTVSTSRLFQATPWDVKAQSKKETYTKSHSKSATDPGLDLGFLNSKLGHSEAM